MYRCFLLFILLPGVDFCVADIKVSSDKIQKNWFHLGRPQLGLAALDRDNVPIPWSAVTYSAESKTAAVWNRTYSFNGDSLLSSINCSDVNLLASSMILNIGMNGQNGSMKFSEPNIIAEKTGKGRLVLQRTGSFAQFRANLIYSIEYDGLIWCELKLLIPENARKLERLQLVAHFPKQTAKLIHYVGAPATYTSQNSPENSYSKALPETLGNCFASGLKTMVWVGNTNYGLLWCTESDEFWWPKDRKNCIRLDRQQDGSVQFTADMVSSLLPPNSPRTLTYSFGLMATPVKPRPEGWRGWTCSTQWDSCFGTKRGSNLFYWPDEYRYMALDQDPSRYINVDNEKKKVARDVREGRRIIPYWSLLNICPKSFERDSSKNPKMVQKINPDAELMVKEWGVTPNNPSWNAKNSYYRLSCNTGWTDYLVWCVEGFAAKMGHLDGVYLDEVQPVPNTRAESLGGYDDFNGARRPTFQFFGTRDLIKRMAYNTFLRNGQRPYLTAHCSATQTLNSLSGCDMLLIGEHFNINYLKSHADLVPPKDDSEEQPYYYSYALPMDRVQTECFGKQWGEVIVWLPQLKDQSEATMKNPITTRDMLSRVMQADVLVWPLWCNADEVYKTWKFRKEFGIGDKNVEFIPYWENTSIKIKSVQTDGILQMPDIVVGYYQNKSIKTYLVLVSNLGKFPGRVEFDFKTLNIKSIKDAETLAQLTPTESGNIRVDLKRNDYKALRINY